MPMALQVDTSQLLAVGGNAARLAGEVERAGKALDAARARYTLVSGVSVVRAPSAGTRLARVVPSVFSGTSITLAGVLARYGEAYRELAQSILKAAQIFEDVERRAQNCGGETKPDAYEAVQAPGTEDKQTDNMPPIAMIIAVIIQLIQYIFRLIALGGDALGSISDLINAIKGGDVGDAIESAKKAKAAFEGLVNAIMGAPRSLEDLMDRAKKATTVGESFHVETSKYAEDFDYTGKNAYARGEVKAGTLAADGSFSASLFDENGEINPSAAAELGLSYTALTMNAEAGFDAWGVEGDVKGNLTVGQVSVGIETSVDTASNSAHAEGKVGVVLAQGGLDGQISAGGYELASVAADFDLSLDLNISVDVTQDAQGNNVVVCRMGTSYNALFDFDINW